jgi:hypothetical protein
VIRFLYFVLQVKGVTIVTKIEQSKFMQIFSVVPDPRKPRNQLYSVADVISTAILAVLCGYDDWEDVSMWAEGQLPGLQPLGICLEGAPSHDTYSRFFRFLDPGSMERFKERNLHKKNADYVWGKLY